MEDDALADELIRRLNALLENPEVRADIEKLIETRVSTSAATNAHPTIQIGGDKYGTGLGFLGLLNGVTGTIVGGKYDGWGYIAAFFDDDNHLSHFQRTEEPHGK